MPRNQQHPLKIYSTAASPSVSLSPKGCVAKTMAPLGDFVLFKKSRGVLFINQQPFRMASFPDEEKRAAGRCQTGTR
jgi:hypothetical protein